MKVTNEFLDTLTDAEAIDYIFPPPKPFYQQQVFQNACKSIELDKEREYVQMNLFETEKPGSTTGL